MKKIYLTLLGVAMLSTTIGQTFDVGGPVSFKQKIALEDKDVPEYTMPSFDLQTQLDEDEINHANKVGPYRFGYEHNTNYDLNNSGVWQVTDKGDRVWRMILTSEGALSINIIFNDFFIPEGAHLHVYNEEKSYMLNAYTSENNNVNNELGTQLVKGESMIVEYFEPQDVAGQGRLLIGTVVHGYRDINSWYPEKVNESGACNMDVICPDGNPWADEIRSEARILNGGGLCTGTLVNNTAEDGTPYFLTANHCGPNSMGSAVFRFNYNSTICGSQSSANSVAPSNNDAINGSIFRAAKADSDFGLVELNSIPPASYAVYYAGWDNSGSTPQTAVGIHHPSGDVKKISFDDDVLQSAQGLSSVSNSEWRIEAWERNTTTEGGSSGSGLWNENHHVVGQLHGGQANCSNSVNDYYGKFSMSWDGNGSSSSAQRLHDWLDPQNTGVTTLDGYDPNQATVAYDAAVLSVSEPSGTYCTGFITPEVTIKNSGSTTMTTATISYNVDGGTNQVYNWSGNLTTGQSENVTLPGMTVSTDGAHVFNVVISSPNGQSDGNGSNDDATGNFTSFANAQTVLINLTLDCWGSETSWEITDQSTSALLWSQPAGTYPDDAPNGTSVTEEICLSDGCYTFTINDDYGDGMSGAQYGSCDVDGDYDIQGFYGTMYVQMTAPAADFGSSTSHDFCIDNTSTEELGDISQFNVYPNPANEELNVQLVFNNNVNDLNIQITDVQGRVLQNRMMSGLSGTQTIGFSLEEMSAGVYFVKVNTGGAVLTKKVLKK